ncbi:MAG TPA: aldehyde dehydrogenase family protein, partial [Gemmatimonadales bacterium]
MSGAVKVPRPVNEPVHGYAPGSPERAALKHKLAEMSGTVIDIPLVIGGKEIRTGKTERAVMPHRHGHQIATWHVGGAKEVEQAIAAAKSAWRDWSTWPWTERAAVLLRAADLLAGGWRPVLNAATMLCQSKTAHQAEIDAACELIDFFRFNVHFAERLYEEQPFSSPGMWNRMEYRPLEGFVFAVTPFNFTAIAGNLPSSAALMGNTVVWKPASSTVFSGYYVMKLFEAAGMPPGVVNFVPGDASAISGAALTDPDLAGIHFTG